MTHLPTQATRARDTEGFDRLLSLVLPTPFERWLDLNDAHLRAQWNELQSGDVCLGLGFRDFALDYYCQAFQARPSSTTLH